MIRTFLPGTRIGQLIVIMIIVALGGFLIYFAATYGLGEYAHVFDR